MEHAVGGRDQPGGHGDVEIDPSGLVGRISDARPEHVAAFQLDRGRDPGLAAGGLRPDEAAVPRRSDRDVRGAGVGDPGGNLAAGGHRLAESDRHPAFGVRPRSEEHKSEIQSLMRISYAVFSWTPKTSYIYASTFNSLT